MGGSHDSTSGSQSSSSSSSSLEPAVKSQSPVELEAVTIVSKRLREDDGFAVELMQQARQLAWGKDWHSRIGFDYGDFLERHKEKFSVVPCPRPYVALVLPTV